MVTARQILASFGHLAAELDALDRHIHEITSQLEIQRHATTALQDQLGIEGRAHEATRTSLAACHTEIDRLKGALAESQRLLKEAQNRLAFP